MTFADDKQANITAQVPPSKIWKTIALGTGIASGEHFCTVLQQRGFFISPLACEVLRQPSFTVAARKTAIHLVAMSSDDLGLYGFVTIKQIRLRALQLGGLGFCSAEVGPQLRLQYPDQPHDEELFVVMDEIADSRGNGRSFILACQDGVPGLGVDEFGYEISHSTKLIFSKVG